MQQSTSHPAEPAGIHVGIIMDGNGRWATLQGRSRSAGHRAGAAMVRRIVEAAPDCGIGVLTLFAFSADNWRRPRTEVGWLMRLFREYLRDETARCVANGVRLDHGSPVPGVDLLIRTGGERRLSDFLLWEAAYAELLFSPLMWPEFGPAALQDAVREFAGRERRFGGLPDAAAG